MKKLKKYLPLILAFFIASGYTVEAQTSKVKFGKGLYVIAADSSMDLKFSARFQTLYEGTQSITDGELNDDFSNKLLVRRSRLKFKGFAFSPKVEYKMEFGLSNRDIGKSGDNPHFNKGSNIILDAVIKYNFYKNFSVWFGQTKLPGNRERVISSQKLQFVDRSLVNANFTIDRDKGVWLLHDHKVGNMLIREKAAVTMGEGRNVTSSSKSNYSYTGRLEILPFGDFDDYVSSDLSRAKRHRLAIAGNYHFNNETLRKEGQTGSFLPEGISPGETTVIHADMMYKYSGISLMVEYGERKASDLPEDTNSVAINPYVTGNGINVQLGYLFKNNFEIAGRFTQVDFENSKDITQYTLGVSRYVVGHSLKVQSDVSYTEIADSETDQLMYRFQVELSF